MMTDQAILEAFAKEVKHFPEKLFKGVELLAHNPEREVGKTPAETIYTEDGMRLIRYKPMVPPEKRHATPVLIVYALINRHIMLDLEPGRSFIQNLLKSGMDVYLIDWGRPTAADRYLDMGDYLNGYLDNAVDQVRSHADSDRINLMGICMGGTFSVIYTALHPEKVKNLITLATPTDFDIDDAILFLWARRMDADRIVSAHGNLPGDLANILYLLAVPVDTVNKYVQFFQNIDNPKLISTFLRMEKWIFDSPDMPGEVFRQYLRDLLQDNLLIRNRLVLEGERVDLGRIVCPLLNVYGKSDYLAPPRSCLPLGAAVGSEDVKTMGVDTGHVGIFVGSMAYKTICPGITDWIRCR
jgi:polyhydroxyalkanoate synthase